uniref:Uncharacterized protein n=1 Tax=Chromera velia CCMP2878 TaxID=1169474 RepID=A0A0G4I698_9ALVE|eukprot:Cvel_11311.t1-p1 / transcript=Cvel_11311.t1 / gene=Cvel_11311 / organism=Chromera_velia_CCMP2878 / gene_product=hypothetical protein / transcript_product=hypothetical protein / location=Cvel_scaffold707:30689-34898(+) / protein_length=527 / sequence_SO=supercontig / SO=protein_coding / is_pseudo=false
MMMCPSRLLVRASVSSSIVPTMKVEALHLSSEAERRQQSEDGLNLFLQHLRLTSEANQRGRVSVDPPQCVNLSGIRGVSQGLVFVLLDLLPFVVPEVKLDSTLVRGPAKSLFLRVLERRLAVISGDERGTLRLKGFFFADNSLGPVEAPDVIRLLLPQLQTLSLKGTQPSGQRRHQGPRIRVGVGAGCLPPESGPRERTGLDSERLEWLCEAIKERGLHGVESLNLSGNELGDHGLLVLCRVLCVSCLPRLRSLLLRHCGIQIRFEDLWGVIGKGGLPELRCLEVEGNGSRGGVRPSLGPFVKVLSVDVVPHLTHRRVKHLNQIDIRALIAGEYPCVRTLGIVPDAGTLTAFVREWSGAERVEGFDVIDLEQSESGGGVGGEFFHFLRLGMERGRLDCLRRLKVRPALIGDIFDPTQNASFLTTLQVTVLPFLSELSLRPFVGSSEQFALLAEVFRVGSLPHLRVLDLSQNLLLRGQEMDVLMEGVIESEEGLPFLEELDLSCTEAGEGIGSIGSEMQFGKLTRLSP